MREDLVFEALANTCGWSAETARVNPAGRHTVILCWTGDERGMERVRAVLAAVGKEEPPLAAREGRPVVGGAT